MPPGVDLELFSPVRAKAAAEVRRSFDLEPDRPIVAIAGRIRPLKGHELAVRALAELHALRGWAPLLVIAGDPTPGEEGFLLALHELAAELGVERDVRWLGALHREELADLLAAASLVLMPSTSETFGLVATRGWPRAARRSSRPASEDSWMPQARAAPCSTPAAQPAWAQELARLLEDDAARATLGLAARGHAERHTWATAATSLLGIYRGTQRRWLRAANGAAATSALRVGRTLRAAAARSRSSSGRRAPRATAGRSAPRPTTAIVAACSSSATSCPTKVTPTTTLRDSSTTMRAVPA